MKKCAKFFYIAYYSAKQTSKYKVNNLLSIISSFIFMAISYHIWISVYAEQNMNSILALQKTLTYVVLIAIINQGICANVENEIGNRVISGDIAVDLLRPMSYVFYIFFNRIGKIIYNMLFSVLPLIIIALIVFKIDVECDISMNIYFLVSILLSIILVFLFEFMLGLVSFITSQVFGVSLLKTAIYNICSGIVIPLSFYPEIFGDFVMNLPFQAMFYIPVSIYCRMENSNNLLQRIIYDVFHVSDMNQILLCEQAFWILILVILAKIIWARCLKKLIVQGG